MNNIGLKEMLSRILRNTGRTIESRYFDDIFEWIFEGFRELKASPVRFAIELKVQDYIVKVPCNLMYITHIIYKDKKIEKCLSTRSNPLSPYYCYQTRSNLINFNFTEDTILLEYTGFEVIDNDIAIPNFEAVKNYLEWYVRAKLLLTGRPDPVASLPDALSFVDKYRLQANASLVLWTPEVAEQILNMSRLTFERNDYKTFFEQFSSPEKPYHDVL